MRCWIKGVTVASVFKGGASLVQEVVLKLLILVTWCNEYKDSTHYTMLLMTVCHRQHRVSVPTHSQSTLPWWLTLPLLVPAPHRQAPALPPGCVLQTEEAEPNQRNPPSSGEKEIFCVNIYTLFYKIMYANTVYVWVKYTSVIQPIRCASFDDHFKEFKIKIRNTFACWPHRLEK